MPAIQMTLFMYHTMISNFLGNIVPTQLAIPPLKYFDFENSYFNGEFNRQINI